MRRKEHNYAFIDSQNLNLGIRDLGWKIDMQKFRKYLKDKYRIEKAFLFIGYIQKYQLMYNNLVSYGYNIIFKPTVENRNGMVKGNVDAELVMHTMKELNNFDKAVIVSGDGDFYCLIKYLNELNKLEAILIPNKKSCSTLLKVFKQYQEYLEDKKLKLKK